MLWLPGYRRFVRFSPKRLGRWGERQARRYLLKQGYSDIARNWACRFGELDLVMAEVSGSIVFVEVKTRRDEIWMPAQQAVNGSKQRKLCLSAKSFVKKYKINKAMRFDVIAVVLPETGPVEIRQYKNAFSV